MDELLFAKLPLVFGFVAFATAAGALYLDSRKIILKVKDDFSTSELVHSGDRLSISDTNIAVRKLVDFAIHKNPDFIIGMNRGGVLVGAYMALSTGVPSKRFYRCCVTNSTSTGIDIDCDIKELYGKVILVDSIVRSGYTMDEVTKRILQDNNKIDKIFTTAIVTTVSKENQPVYSPISFYAFSTKNSLLQLPWTKSKPASNSVTRSNQIKKEFQEVRKEEVVALAGQFYSKLEKNAI